MRHEFLPDANRNYEKGGDDDHQTIGVTGNAPIKINILNGDKNC